MIVDRLNGLRHTRENSLFAPRVKAQEPERRCDQASHMQDPAKGNWDWPLPHSVARTKVILEVHDDLFVGICQLSISPRLLFLITWSYLLLEAQRMLS